jgi:hypothetical protein
MEERLRVEEQINKDGGYIYVNFWWNGSCRRYYFVTNLDRSMRQYPSWIRFNYETVSEINKKGYKFDLLDTDEEKAHCEICNELSMLLSSSGTMFLCTKCDNHSYPDD